MMQRRVEQQRYSIVVEKWLDDTGTSPRLCASPVPASFRPSSSPREAIARQPEGEEDGGEDPQDMGHEGDTEEDERRQQENGDKAPHGRRRVIAQPFLRGALLLGPLPYCAVGVYLQSHGMSLRRVL